MGQKDSKKVLLAIILFFIIIVIFRIFYPYYLRVHVVQAFRLPSSVMEPTINKWDRVLVNKAAYKKADPKRGDIIVFLYPEDRSRIFLKRVIAFGGETVEIRNGDVYVNDELVQIPSIKNINYYNRGEYGQSGEKVMVPEGNIYVLGDNSASSADSRYWGFVPKENIKGKVFVIYYPFDRMGSVK
jgi:signal peptidase I